jgi:hypothetical protein
VLALMMLVMLMILMLMIQMLKPSPLSTPLLVMVVMVCNPFAPRCYC